MKTLVLLLALAAWAPAQTPGAQSSEKEELVPGKRMVRAVQYPFDLKVKFTLFPTGRLQGVEGSAQVIRRKKAIEVEVEIDKAPPAGQFKPEYRTYVVWALTPAGKFVSLGALERAGTLKTTTTLPAFGIVVSAEADTNATSPGDPILESGFPDAKRRFYPIHRVIYTPGVK